jgi:biotin synthase-like enzyme
MKRAGRQAIEVWSGGIHGLSELIRERVPDDVERQNLLDDAVRDLENPRHHLYALTY